MPTQRRLINKRAFEEMKLLEKRIEMSGEEMELSLKIVNGHEMFRIKTGTGKVLFGRTYTEIEKMLSVYLIQKNE